MLSRLDSGNSEDSNRIEVENVVSVSESIATLEEMFPFIETSILIEILTGNNWDMNMSFEAALAYSATRDILEHTNKVTAGEGVFSTIPAVEMLTKHGSEVLATPPYRITGPIDIEDKEALLDENIDPEVPMQVHPQIRRGRAIQLGSSFLAVPRIRVVTTRRTDWLKEYTVYFRKIKEKLGISVKQIGNDIYIQKICDMNSFDSMYLAQAAGIEVGDILVGVNKDMLKQTVMNLNYLRKFPSYS